MMAQTSVPSEKTSPLTELERLLFMPGRSLLPVDPTLRDASLVIRPACKHVLAEEPFLKGCVSTRLGSKDSSQGYESVRRAAASFITKRQRSLRPATLEELILYWRLRGRTSSDSQFDGLVALGTELFWPKQLRVTHPVLTYHHADEDRPDDPEAGIWLSERSTGPGFWPGFHRYLFVACP